MAKLADEREIRAFGTWASPISAETIAAQGIRFGAVAVDGSDIYWIEGRPHEGGRNALVRRLSDGTIVDVVPPPYNVRSRVHEYGGVAYAVGAGDVYFSNFADQRIYRVSDLPPLRGSHEATGGITSPVPITPEGRWFFADYAFDRVRNRIVCVREDHSASGEPVNTLVSIPLDRGLNAGEVIASGYDFYSTPRFSPDGSQLSWIAWRHPNMPWDGTELWLADAMDSGALSGARCVAGGEDESIYQPGWSPDGVLLFVSDRDDWWRLYRFRGDATESVLKNPPPDAEFGRPQWVFGTSTWAFVGPSRILAAYTQRGHWHLADVDAQTGEWRRVDTALQPYDWMAADPSGSQPVAVLIAASATQADALVQLDVSTGASLVVRAASSLQLDEKDVSRPQSLEFPTADGDVAHAFYYAPANRRYHAAADDRPPLVAISHGGPTTAANATLDLRIQFWTTRGFAVIDVNYRGSSGFGRAYRNALRHNWGIADVEDMVHAGHHLVATGQADESRLIIRGGSAGGYTTLAALTFHPGVFKAGASYYGVSDIEVLARDTHKFEARYLDRLIGSYPDAREQYRARSPIHFVDRLACPIILFQGLEDKVVPPNQSEMMAAAARAKGLPVTYLAFEGEQHGFRKADTIVRCLEAELYFYGRVFGFTPADRLPPVPIDNL